MTLPSGQGRGSLFSPLLSQHHCSAHELPGRARGGGNVTSGSVSLHVPLQSQCPSGQGTLCRAYPCNLTVKTRAGAAGALTPQNSHQPMAGRKEGRGALHGAGPLSHGQRRTPEGSPAPWRPRCSPISLPRASVPRLLCPPPYSQVQVTGPRSSGKCTPTGGGG